MSQTGNKTPRDLSPVPTIASIDRPPDEHEGIPVSKIYKPYSIHVVALLIPASIFGLLARLGLEALATYDGQSIFLLAYPQAVGCLIMGFAVHLKAPFGQFYGPLYTAVTTGFCGSLTTFSSWQVDIFESWLNSSDYHRGGLRDFIDGVGKTAFTLSISLASLSFGSSIAKLIAPRLPKIPPPTFPIRYSISALCILIYAATFPLYFRLDPDFRHQAISALLFAFPGALTRYVLSTQLNPLLSSFPVGTFAANSLATAFLAVFHVLQRKTPSIPWSACSTLQGLSDGYCGCLSTVSTFAVEVKTLKRWSNVRYVLASWVTAQLLLLVIIGPALLSQSVSERTMCSFDP
ncbi:CrcB-like protein-domain-containing protein [Desarmillaria tabescens]|uniref:CrcB-like protein-domain-containing protein n=1 Tax=Armillaria tabescens TaxID=1929756 RepID=A0AA39NMN4_ARMTA|nr:CrcB-like protein-domain-containing protein [Desarmillaria tabescens]KAK0468472.1 CrcB-like protein-domain-containing protein [Desarmillaria tabescens]